MHKKNIKIIITLGILTLMILMGVLFNWAKNAVDLQEKQFNHKVKTALSIAGYKLRLFQHQSISSIHPVKQINENQFIVEIQDVINPLAIDSILQQEFKALEMNLTYNIAIYDCFTDSVVYSLGGSKLQETVPAEEYGVNWNLDAYNSGVIFNDINKNRNYINIWVISVGAMLMLFGLIGYIIYLLIQQQKLGEIKNDFINNMTHELKTPISTISLSADVLCKTNSTDDPERTTKYAEIIKEENNRLKTQVELVLQTAFLEHENLTLNIEKLNVLQVLQSAISPFKLRLDTLGGNVSITGQELYLNGDTHHLTHLFSNLIDNAIKYTNDAPNIEIIVKAVAGSVEIRITDSGIGMQQDVLKNIFKKFYRVPTGDVHNVKGFGIGLNYVQLVVNQHKGNIKVKSEVGIGTVFTLEFPSVK